MSYTARLKAGTLSKPLIVSIPHKLGREEALRRLRGGLGDVRNNFAQILKVEQEVWTGDQLAFRIRALGQAAEGKIDVASDYIQLEVTLPWLLAMAAEKLSPMIRKEGLRLLEKK